MLPRAKKKKIVVFQVWYENQRKWMKGANSAFRQEVHRGRGFAFSETHCLHQAEMRERYWES